MKRFKNIKGQFFLISALIIVAVILSIGTIYNYARSPTEDKKVEEVSKELSFEGSRVIDSGMFRGSTESEILSNLNSLSANYTSLAQGSDIVILYGNSTSISPIAYLCKPDGSASIGSDVSLPAPCRTEKISKDELSRAGLSLGKDGDEKIKLSFKGENYQFKLMEKQNFYLVVRKTNNGETYVSTSQN